MKEEFEFKLIEDFLGYNSSSDKTKVQAGTLIRGSKNVIKKLSGNVASRCGVKRRGSVDDTDAGVKSEFVFNTNVGTVRPLRVCNGKLQVESDIVTDNTFVWYDLLITSTLAHPAATLTRFVFDTWWDDDEKTDRLVMVRGDDTFLHWSGAMTKFSSSGVGTTTGLLTVSMGTSGGSGYAVGDILTVAGGTGGSVKVLSASGGSVTSVEVYNPGTGYSTGTDIATSGSGTGCQVDIDAIGTYYTITKQGVESWAEAGFATIVTGERKFIVSGVEFTYYSGGEDTTTLTAVTPNPSSLVSGDVIIQSVIIANDIPIANYEADFIKTINNQLWIGSYSSRIIYISADVEGGGFPDFTNSGAHLLGDPDLLVLDSQARGIGVHEGKVILFSGDSNLTIVTPNSLTGNSSASFVDPSDSGVRFVYQKIENKKLAGLTSALGHEFIGNLGEYLVWLDQKNRLRAVGSFANITSIKPINLSLPVQNELTEDTFTGGHLKVVSDNDGDTVYISAPVTGRDWMYQIREKVDDNGQIVTERLWQPPQVRAISRFSVIEGVLYGHSNVNPQIYQIWDTGQWFDDHASGEEIPYIPVARFAYQQHERRQGRIMFDSVYFEGYMAEGQDLDGVIFLDYQGSTATRDFTISDDDDIATFFSGSVFPSLGDSPFGDNPLGDGVLEEANDQENIPKFRAIIRIPQPKNCFEYGIELFSLGVDCRWEILCFGANARLASENATFIKK